MVPFNQGSQSALQTSTTLPLLLLLLILLLIYIYFSILQVRNLRHKKKKWFAAGHIMKRKSGVKSEYRFGTWRTVFLWWVTFPCKVTLALLWCRVEWSLQLYLSFQENNTRAYIIQFLCVCVWVNVEFHIFFIPDLTTLLPYYLLEALITANSHGYFLNNSTAIGNTQVHCLGNSNWKTKRKCSSKKPCLLALGQVFLWDKNTALQGLDACLPSLLSMHSCLLIECHLLVPTFG